MKPVIMVHGGAKTIAEDKAKANYDGCLAAVEAGWAILAGGGKAKDAVEAAIRVLENDEMFNCSIGSTLDVEGEAGCILLDSQGRIGWAYNSQDMAVAYRTMDMKQAAVFRKKEEENSAFSRQAS